MHRDGAVLHRKSTRVGSIGFAYAFPMETNVLRFSMRDPSDVSELAAAIRAGSVDPARIVAVLGKTEGNGLVNDFTRGYLIQSLKLLLGKHGDKPVYVFSGGTEGVLSPHYAVFCVDEGTPSRGKSLAIGCAITRNLRPEEIGTTTQVDLVRDAVAKAMKEAKLSRDEVSFVQVKAPGGTSNQSMALARVAGAFGVGAALGEIKGFSEKDFLKNLALQSPRASVSSGIEIAMCEVMVLGNSAAWSGPLRIASRPMADAMDLDAVLGVLADLGIERNANGLSRVRAVMVKGEADTSGSVRGHRHTMLTDGDMSAQRHIRGALGGLVAGVFGDGRLFVSGGAEHQGPAGGGLIAAIAETG
jgi:cyanuric acid amidohydrolase